MNRKEFEEKFKNGSLKYVLVSKSGEGTKVEIEFMELINNAIDKFGYVPIGGISITLAGNKFLFSQAMIKKDRSKNAKT